MLTSYFLCYTNFVTLNPKTTGLYCKTFYTCKKTALLYACKAITISHFHPSLITVIEAGTTNKVDSNSLRAKFIKYFFS